MKEGLGIIFVIILFDNLNYVMINMYEQLKYNKLVEKYIVKLNMIVEWVMDMKTLKTI